MSAIEAVSIAQIGSEYNDLVLLRNASSLYRQALASLTQILSRGDADQDTLAASLLMQLCEASGPS